MSQLESIGRRIRAAYNPKTAFGDKNLIELLDAESEEIERLKGKVECEECDGTGEVRTACDECRGTGLIPKKKE